MFSWLAEKLIAHNMKAIRAGDIKPTTLLYTDDVGFKFPGDSSFAPGASMREYEVYEDTEETRRLDRWLDAKKT